MTHDVESKHKDNLTGFFIIIGCVTFFVGGMWAIWNIEIATMVVIVSSPLLIYLANRRQLQWKILSDFIRNSCLVGSLTAFFAISHFNGKHEAYLNSLVLDGHIEKQKILIEADSETSQHFEDYYRFLPVSENKTSMRIVSWSFSIIGWASFFFILRFTFGGKAVKKFP